MSVQLARKPEPAAPANTETAEGGEGNRRRNSTRGRGRGRGRAGRASRGGRKVNGEEGADAAAPAQTAPLAATTNEVATTEAGQEGADKTRQPRKQRGPPEDGVASKTKIMVANLPYDLREERVSLATPLYIKSPLT